MPDACMTFYTVEHLVGVTGVGGNLAHQPFVTANAVLLQNCMILGFDANRLWKILQSKGFGVEKAIFRLGKIFTDEVMGQMAVVAGGSLMMAGLLPTIILFAHDVAVDASLGVIG